MIREWLKETHRKDTTPFNIIDVTELKEVNEDIMKFLAKVVLVSYRDNNFLVHAFKSKSKKEVISYLEKYVFPGDSTQLTKNVKQGDFGEIVSKELITKIRKLNAPFCKLMWKFNKDKSVFCTDIIAHSFGNKIKDIIYYEVKTRIKKSVNVCIEAHNSLKKDLPTESIADYLQRRFFEQAELLNTNGDSDGAEIYYDLSDQYSDIVTNSSNYNKYFEIIILIEKDEFDEDHLENLKKLPPELNPLCVTVICIKGLKELYEKIYELAKEEAVKLCCKL